MRDWNTHVLIACGFVLGATAMLVAAPYFMAVELVEDTKRVSGLLEGYGDIYGGIITGVLALGVGYILWRIQEDKKDAANRKLHAVYADQTLTPLGSFRSNLKMLFDMMEQSKPHVRNRFVRYCQNMTSQWEKQLEQINIHPPHPDLGLNVIALYKDVTADARNMTRNIGMYEGEVAEDEGLNAVVYQSFKRMYENVNTLITDLERIRDAKP